ncbi:MAG: hypothetical protein R6X35_09730 [Candidatus Krumholzibacteriia bacterium]
MNDDDHDFEFDEFDAAMEELLADEPEVEPSEDAQELQRVHSHCARLGQRIRLPREFARSFGGCFTHCIICGDALIDNGRKKFSFVRMRHIATPYCIVKEVHRGEPWLEFAICAGCAAGVQSLHSAESAASIDRLFVARTNLQVRFTRLIAGPAPVRDWLARCVLTGDRIDPQGTYRLKAYCEGGRLVLSTLPYAIGERGLAMLEAALSAESAAARDEFVRRYLGVDAVV